METISDQVMEESETQTIRYCPHVTNTTKIIYTSGFSEK